MIKNRLFILVGIVSIGLSIMCFASKTGTNIRSQFYGGDAFTGIQHAAADTGENVRELSKITAKGFGSILLVSGLTLIVLGIPSKREGDEIVVEGGSIQQALPEISAQDAECK